MEINFNPLTHEYSIGSQKVLSVTQVMKDAGLIDFSGIPKDKLHFAATRGTYVHKATELYDLGNLDPSSLDSAIVPFVEAYRSFRGKVDFKPTLIEHKVFNRARGYAGTLDRAGLLNGILNGRKVVIDIKTGKVSKTAGIQLAAYKYALGEEWSEADRYVLKLTEAGVYNLVPYTDKMDLPIFLYALGIAKWKKANGL
jgi:hypothetical protein